MGLGLVVWLDMFYHLQQTDVYDGGHMPQVGKLGNGIGVLKAVTMLEEGQCKNKVVTVV